MTAFYERDPAAVRAAGRMAVFPPDELVCVRVRFTRVLFAQLAQQRFDPPRRWPMPPPAHPEHKAAALGAKLAAGFEMLAAEWARAGVALPLPGAEAAAGAAAAQAGPPATMPPPADDDPGWQAFRASLERAGFFAGGADALKRAAAAYGTTAAYARFVAAAAAPAERAAAVLAQAGPLCAEAFGPPPGPEADDPEGWLLEGEALLERALAARDAERAAHEARRAAKRGPTASAPDEAAAAPPDTAAGDAEAAEELGHVARGVRAFVAARGSMQGASVPDAEAPELQVDPSRFLRELSEALGLDLDELRGDGAGSSSGSGSDTDSSDSTDLSDDFEVDTEDDEEDADANAAAGGAAEPMDADAAGWRRFRPADDESSDSDDEAATSDDSDDDAEQQQRPRGRGGFGAAYSAALDAQLRGTAMATDFARAPAATAASDAAPDAEDDEAMRPVDVDLNLVQSLLASYTAQEGLPGPASNMLGLLGLALPDDADRRNAGEAT